jgi:cell division protein FtsB
MREFQERRVLRRIVFSGFSFVFLASILAFLVYSTAKIYIRSRNAQEANNLIEQEIEFLKAEKAELEASVKRLQTETGAEEEIRSKFPVQKPGEKTVVIIEEENKNNLPTSASLSFPQKIRQFIKDIF